jgi:hypothetical protein
MVDPVPNLSCLPESYMIDRPKANSAVWLIDPKTALTRSFH